MAKPKLSAEGEKENNSTVDSVDSEQHSEDRLRMMGKWGCFHGVVDNSSSSHSVERGMDVQKELTL